MPNPSTCIVCASNNLDPLLDTFSVPTDTCRIWPSQADARAAVKASIDLCSCRDCGHIFNRNYDDDLVDYETDYENSLIFSPRFRAYAEQISDRLIAKYDLHGKHIVEIGGGRGDFLRVICDRGNNFGVSFGPSYRPGPNDQVPANLRFVTDYYNEKYAGEPANLIVCRHVLEHFWEPRGFITSVRRAVADRTDVAVYFEVPSGEYILQNHVFWDFIYQHCSYFTKSSLARLFTDCGFAVRDIYESFGDQFLAIEVSANNPDSGTQAQETNAHPRAGSDVCPGFTTAFSATAAMWRNRLDDLRTRGKRIVAWGAGAKAVTFLNIVDPAASAVSKVVDINPRKSGRFIPGSGQEIVAPSALPKIQPEVIVLMNPIYRDEISSTVRAIGLDPEILVA